MKCTVIAILALFVVASYAINVEKEYQNEFTKFMQKHRKSYHAEEFKTRYEIFKANLRFIAAKNQENTSYTVAMNKFGDMTNEEFRKFYLGVSAPKMMQQIVSEPEAIRADAPASLDWREKNAVTHVKNQGQCGSCWSFSTTGSTEGCHAISTGKLVALSEQNLMDCSTSQGNQGCNGGLMTQAMDYIISNGGIDTEESYPYTAADGTSCNYKSANRGATLKSYKNVASGDENSLLNTAVSGPVSVAIDASQNSFQFYSGGVYYEPACSSQQLDHGVLVVGYGADAGTDYWWVKNSWGTDWGLSGYIKMSRNRSNNCGIATMATLPSC